MKVARRGGRWIARLLARAKGLRATRELRAGRYESAGLLYEDALGLEPRDARIECHLWNGLGMTRKYQARFSESARAYLHAMRHARREPSLPPSDWASLYHNLGGLEHARGRYRRAEVFSRRSVLLREKALGAEHPEVARDLAAHAAILDGLARHEEAESTHRRAIAIFERRRDALEAAYARANLAASLHAQRKSTEAERVLRQALEVQRRRLGPSHPDVGLGLYNLAVIELSRERRDEARSAATEALSILERGLGVAHPASRACRELLSL